jgi:hypothetical protein
MMPMVAFYTQTSAMPSLHMTLTTPKYLTTASHNLSIVTLALLTTSHLKQEISSLNVLKLTLKSKNQLN